MPIEAQIEHVPLSKRRLLEFLESQKGPVTAKVASIDLDSRASTVTEMLERCVAQCLVERKENHRPREYTITELGWRRLEFFRSGRDKSQLESVSLGEQTKTDAQAGVVRDLYEARYEFLSLSWFDSKEEVKARIANLEGMVGKETAEQVACLVSLEDEIRTALDDKSESLCGLLQLRDRLHLPASVFDLCGKNSNLMPLANKSW